MICCPLSNDSDAYVRFHNVSVRTARKEHTCHECSETIPRNSQYEYVSGKWDDHMSTFKTCMSCVEIRNHFACGSGWTYGEVWNDLQAHFFPDMKAGGPCMDGLSPAAKARLFERRLQWLEDNAS